MIGANFISTLFCQVSKKSVLLFYQVSQIVFYSVALILKSYFILPHNNELDFYSTKFHYNLFYFHTSSLNYNLFSRTSVESINKLTISTKFLKHCHPLTLIQTNKKKPKNNTNIFILSSFSSLPLRLP